MAKLLHILAASVGGGLALGAGIRLGEAISSPGGRRKERAREPERPGSRLDRMEREIPVGRVPGNRVKMDEPATGWQSALSGIVERMDRQQSELAAVQRQLSGATRVLDSVGEIAGDLRDDLHRELSGDLDRRLEAVERSLHLRLEAVNLETTNAMVESIEKKLAPRIERLESKISGQAASVAELRDCALQSERSILRLLTVLEKNMNPASTPDNAELPRLSVVR